jgi:hypothetical protein
MTRPEPILTNREAVLRAVNLGHDADTTGAVCGQLAGASWGVAGIPPDWLDGLARREELEMAVVAVQAFCRCGSTVRRQKRMFGLKSFRREGSSPRATFCDCGACSPFNRQLDHRRSLSRVRPKSP